jgi:hypothetical protein
MPRNFHTVLIKKSNFHFYRSIQEDFVLLNIRNFHTVVIKSFFHFNRSIQEVLRCNTKYIKIP